MKAQFQFNPAKNYKNVVSGVVFSGTSLNNLLAITNEPVKIAIILLSYQETEDELSPKTKYPVQYPVQGEE